MAFGVFCSLIWLLFFIGILIYSGSISNHFFSLENLYLKSTLRKRHTFSIWRISPIDIMCKWISNQALHLIVHWSIDVFLYWNAQMPIDILFISTISNFCQISIPMRYYCLLFQLFSMSVFCVCVCMRLVWL